MIDPESMHHKPNRRMKTTGSPKSTEAKSVDSFNEYFRYSWLFNPKLKTLLQHHMGKLLDTTIQIRLGSDHEDSHQVGDFVFEIDTEAIKSELMIGARVRKPIHFDHYDVTIRSKRAGFQTELEKIKSGVGDFMIYAWALGKGKDPLFHKIMKYVIVDFQRMRDTGVLDERWREIENKDPKTGKPDGTAFKPIGLGRLKKLGCIVVQQPNPKGEFGQVWDDDYGKRFQGFDKKERKGFPAGAKPGHVAGIR
jgi:hypothetical protein